MIERTIGQDQAGQRLDKYLRRLFREVPQSHIYKLLRLRRVRVNGRRAHEDTLLAEGDQVVVRGDAEKLMAPSPPGAGEPATGGEKLVVLFEDEDLLAVDKPAGLAVHPGSGLVGATLVDLARAHVRALSGEVPAGAFLPSPAHRLDRETSGVILVAKRRQAIVRLTEQFTAGEVEKRYLALAKGRFAAAEGRIDLALAEHEQTARSRGARGVNFQEAVTHWQRLAEGPLATALAVRLETGRTHQIRRHLAAEGHPIAGDRRHGDFPFNRLLRAQAGLRRMFLHAERLALRHPTRPIDLDLRAPLPQELAQVLERLAVKDAGPPTSGDRA